MKQFPGQPLAKKNELPISPIEYLEIAWKRKWWLIIPIPISMVVAVLLLVYLPKSYRSSTLILVEAQKVPEDYVKSPVSGTIEDRLGTIRQQILSRSLLQRIMTEFGLYKKELKTQSLDEVIALMQKQIEIHTVGAHQTVDAFTISFEGSDPKTTMEVTNKLASLYIEENLKIREQLVEGTTDFLGKELNSLKEALDLQEQKMSQLKQKYMGGLPQQLDANLRTLDRYQQELQTLAGSLKLAEDRKMLLERSLSDENATPIEAPDVQTPTEQERYLNQQYAQLSRMKKDLENLRADYTDSYPDILLLKRKIKEAEEELSRQTNAFLKEKSGTPSTPSNSHVRNRPINPAVQNQLRSVEEEIDSLKEREKRVMMKSQQLEKDVEKTPSREQEMMSLVRDYENTKKAYQALLDKQYNARLSESLEKRQKGEQFRILDPANLPEKPFKPNPLSLVAVCLAGGFGVGVGFILLVEFLDTSFKKPEEIEKILGLNVLVSIPQIRQKEENIKKALSVHSVDATEERVN